MTGLSEEGGVFIPKRVGWGAVWVIGVGGISFLFTIGTMWTETKANVYNELANLRQADADSRARGDLIRSQLKELESVKVTVIRMEERQKAQDEALREILTSIRARR